jgi:hypothetical protein
MRWFERKRLEFIAEFVHRKGYLNRKHIVEEFGVSLSQASYDIKKFKALNTGVIEYDRTDRTHRLVAEMHPKPGWLPKPHTPACADCGFTEGHSIGCSHPPDEIWTSQGYKKRSEVFGK